jgi:hypothetical protein
VTNTVEEKEFSPQIFQMEFESDIFLQLFINFKLCQHNLAVLEKNFLVLLTLGSV